MTTPELAPLPRSGLFTILRWEPSCNLGCDEHGSGDETRVRSVGSMDPGTQVRHWLLSVTTATLCTLASEPEIEGWPFGSLTPFALGGDGTPIVLLSELAQHTKNVRRDPRVSLFVRDPSATGDAQAGWRVTVLCRARPVERPDLEEVHARYCARVPNAPSYLETHDFAYFALDPFRVRMIGGFGVIHWLAGESVMRDPLGGGLREDAPWIIAHLNGDHEEALRTLVTAATGVRPARARLRYLDRAGFLVDTTSPDALRYVGFGREIEASEAREAFVALVQDAHTKVSG